MKPFLRFNIAGEELPLEPLSVTAAGTEVLLYSVPYTPAMLDKVAGLRAGALQSGGPDPKGMRERDWPYWLEDWPATYALAEVLADAPPPTGAATALDIGCGTGFLAAFLRKRFGLKVFSCDFNFDACRLAFLNGRASQPSAPPLPSADASAVFCADFSALPIRGSFDLVFGGEMLYAEANHAPILALLRDRLKPAGRAYLADPGRSAAVNFAALAAAAGFKVEMTRIASPAARRHVHVYELSWAGGAGRRETPSGRAGAASPFSYL